MIRLALACAIVAGSLFRAILAIPLPLVASLEPASAAACSFDSVVTKEHLLFQDIPQVITATRQTVSVLESPATASVITRDDILHSAYTSVIELLRYEAGIDFFKSNNANGNMGMRGVNGLQANNVMVLVDGRPIYNPTKNTNQCAMVPLVQDDIERMEIVRGPGSVLYGSHAFAGVVNIITREPEEIAGTRATAIASSNKDGLYSILTGGRSGKTAYKFLAAWTEAWADDDWHDSLKGLSKMAGSLTHELGPETSVDASFGVTYGRLNVKNDIVLEDYDQDGVDGFLRAGINKGEASLDLWWRHHDTEGDLHQAGEVDWKFDMVNLSLQDKARFGANTLVYGAEGRWATLGASSYDDWHQQFLYGLFAEDRWNLTQGLNLFLGARADHHPHAGWALSPRASLVKELDPFQSLRLTVARAFKYPSYLQNYAEIVSPFYVHLGNRDLDPEKLTSIEIAWQGYGMGNFSAAVSAFYNRYDDMIDLTYSVSSDRVRLSYDNLYDMYQYGFELEATYRPSPCLMLRGNYSYVWKEKGDELTYGPVPTNSVNFEARYDHGSGLWVDLRVHWQDRADYSTGISGLALSDDFPPHIPTGGPPIDPDELVSRLVSWETMEAYLLGDLAMGYRPSHGRWAAALAFHNIFFDRFREVPGGKRKDTTVTLKLSVDF